MGFPDSSAGKESTDNAGDPDSILGSGESTGEGIGYPLQCSCLENPMRSKTNKRAKKKKNVSLLCFFLL